ncbi:MAG: extracellular solute-binding protein, partial [Armatimonadetes bacterium]|nr:extracellular solute-binding protein [Armatimonadota bacterium]
DIRLENAGGLELANELAESAFLISMAADTAPDVFYVNFRQYYNYIEQGFCRPLDDLIAGDPSVEDRFNPLVMDVVRSYDGRTYAVPFYQVAQALYYRKDHFVEAGLDPGRPPKTWDEFYEYGQRLTEAAPGRSGFVFSSGLGGKAYWWTNFVWQAGGEVVVPAENGYWRSAIDSPEAALALDFFRKMTVDKWETDGRQYGPMAAISGNWGADVAAGKVSMWFSYTNDVFLSISDLNPALIGMGRMPAGPAGPMNEINAGMWAINSSITDPKKLEACWRFIKFFVGQDAARVQTHALVELGLGNLVNPVLLNRYGYEDIARTVDPGYVAANEDLFKTGKPEPYGRNCQQVYIVLDAALDRAILEPDTPSATILRDVSREMDSKLLGFTPAEVMARRRGWATGILLFVLLAGTALTIWLIRRPRPPQDFEERPLTGAERRPAYRFMAVCLLPAGLSVLVWAYWPLLHGLVIAFQDYGIARETTWVGLDNFIAVATEQIFWKSIWNSFVYVGLTIVIGFFIPIFLALALHEIPRFKVLFRTIFYLPAMTSPIVVAFLWRQFYDKGETGLLNQIVGPVIDRINLLVGTGFPLTFDWLGDPSLAMFSVVLPGIWAGAGPGSILYLAALKNVPEERYEAADIDGASWQHKIRYISMPGLKPLILINLLGVFIAGFKAMENIFVLTGGGPLYSTHTIGLEVWTNAFVFLKFGYATAAAWVMGAILIGFTVVQLKYLTRMKFTAAKF